MRSHFAIGSSIHPISDTAPAAPAAQVCCPCWGNTSQYILWWPPLQCGAPEIIRNLREEPSKIGYETLLNYIKLY